MKMKMVIDVLKCMIYIGIGVLFTLAATNHNLLLIAIIGYILLGIYLIVKDIKNEMDTCFITKDDGKFHYCRKMKKEIERENHIHQK